MVHALLPEASGGGDPYAVARKNLDRWIADKALRQDDTPSFYPLEQRFTGLDHQAHVRRGFFAVTKIPEPGESIVLGHERTFEGPVEDRLKLTEATQANLGPIFVLYPDPDGVAQEVLDRVFAAPAEAECLTSDGVRQRLWRAEWTDALTAFFEDKRLYIADGHHRFKTAGVYRDRMREREQPEGLRPYDYILMGFVPFEDPGLLIWAPHRLVKAPAGFDEAAFIDALRAYFDVAPAGEDLLDRVETAEAMAFGLRVRGGGSYLLTLRQGQRDALVQGGGGAAWRSLNVVVLHQGVLEGLLGLPAEAKHGYEPQPESAEAALAAGEADLLFLLQPISPAQVRACAEAGDPMPQKSTYFFPKLPSGAVIHRLV
jgi:uncharacterized protein (DUF1015 family)